jgi:hypothetical protein
MVPDEGVLNQGTAGGLDRTPVARWRQIVVQVARASAALAGVGLPLVLAGAAALAPAPVHFHTSWTPNGNLLVHFNDRVPCPGPAADTVATWRGQRPPEAILSEYMVLWDGQETVDTFGYIPLHDGDGVSVPITPGAVHTATLVCAYASSGFTYTPVWPALGQVRVAQP